MAEKKAELRTGTYKGYTDYTIYENGLVYCISKNRYIKIGYSIGYANVSLNCKNYRLHRILATLFIPNPENKPEVNHIDGNKANYSLDNLEWCTRKENVQHAIKTGLRDKQIDYAKKASKPIVQKDKDGNVVNQFKSIHEAHRITGFALKWISACANGGSYRDSGGQRKWVNCKTIGGFKWEFAA